VKMGERPSMEDERKKIGKRSKKKKKEGEKKGVKHSENGEAECRGRMGFLEYHARGE